jgi:hypothetical protein
MIHAVLVNFNTLIYVSACAHRNLTIQTRRHDSCCCLASDHFVPLASMDKKIHSAPWRPWQKSAILGDSASSPPALDLQRDWNTSQRPFSQTYCFIARNALEEDEESAAAQAAMAAAAAATAEAAEMAEAAGPAPAAASSNKP